MQLYELKKAIKDRNIPPILLFAGLEQELMSLYIRKITEVYELNIRQLDFIKDLLKELKSRSLNGKSKLFVIRNSKEFKQNEKLWEILPTLVGDNRIIFIYDTLDKREKFYKKFNKKDELAETAKVDIIELVEFEKLTTDQLCKHILKIVDLKEHEAKKLAEICDNDFGRCLLESDKLKNLYLAYDKKIDYTELFYESLHGGLFYIKPEDRIFDFIDYVLKNKAAASFELLEDLKKLKTPEVIILSLLYTNFKNILLVQGCHGKVSTETTGLNSWQIFNARKNLEHFSITELLDNLKYIRETEKGVKTGSIDSKIAIDYLLARILR